MTSYNPFAWVVKRPKLNSKKGVMWDTLLNKLGLDKDNFEEKNMEMEMEREQTMDTEDVEELGEADLLEPGDNIQAWS